MSKAVLWQRGEILEMLSIVRTSGIGFLNGTRSNQNGELFQHIVQRMKASGKFPHRDAAQIETKWKVLTGVYDRIKSDDRKPASQFEFYTEMDEIFELAAKRNKTETAAGVQLQGVESLAPMEFYTVTNDGFLTEDTEDQVIEEVVFDSQDGIEFAELAAQPARTRRKKLTAENMQALLDKIAEMQRKHHDDFNKKQMDVIETEFEAFRTKERDHMLQLKLDMEVLKTRYLERIVKVARGEASAADVLEEVKPVTAQPSKRRKTSFTKRN
ncbi:uncharacterized protein LOC131210767 [Anopheles bellator]|uniref:uncharacterized protein LOC131210767 n=1 Tax=Anopheles bellator TaxID=139047 RepID=UPI002649618B|nr:uncharacterized protein LOC131210767 [Anopheles bellator]